ncbi:hypothetical protein THAOC_05648, partial [Thalassiosira oceanica]
FPRLYSRPKTPPKWCPHHLLMDKQTNKQTNKQTDKEQGCTKKMHRG